MCSTLSFNLNQCNDNLTSFSVMKNKIAPILFLFFSLYSFGQTSSFNRGGQFSLGTEKVNEEKFNKRYIHPKRKSISIYSGLGLMQTSIKTSNPYYKNAFDASFIPEISFEQGIKSNFYFETSLNFNEMQRKTVFINNDQKASSSIGGFSILMLSTGVNYKVQLPKSHLQLFNLHAGIGLGARTSNQFPKVFEKQFNTQIVNQTFIHSVSGKVIPVLYLGLSKDIRLNEHWSLNLQYKKQFGLNTIVQTDIYYQLPNSSETMYAKGILNGTGHLFRLGLTYHLPQKDK